jgi:hypothetical protein
MTIFQIETPVTPAATLLANGFLTEANQKFEAELNAVYDGIQRFWYRNRDENGNPSLTGSEPTGVEILQAMGPAAAPFLAVAYARVEMLLGIQQQLGLDVLDMSKASAPFNFTFNPDGSLATATPK